VCDRVTIIREGRTVQSGTLTELRHLTRTTISAEVAGVPDGLGDLPGVHALCQRDHQVSFEVDNDHLGAVMDTLTTAGLRSLVSHPPTLEELFLRQYRDEPEPEAPKR